MMGTIDQRAILGAVNRIAARLRANPEDSELHYALGLAYLNLGRLNTAVECLKRSQQLVPRPALEPDIAALSTPPCSTQVTAKPEVSDPGEIDGARGEGQVREQAAEPKVVLIAEDSATMRKLVAGALEKEGYTVVTAADGAEAVEKFHETPVDLVLLDVVMPNMDGYQVCRTLRAANKTLPIVLLSARDGLFDKFRGKVAGCSAYIAKPFLREDLVASVQQFCPLNNQQEILRS
jgi:CheY-like chemotaxis protein